MNDYNMIDITLTIPRKRLYYLIITANEHCGYWARIVREHVPEGADLSWLRECDFFDDGRLRWPWCVAPIVGGSVTYIVVDDDDRKGERYILNDESIRRGLAVMLEKYPGHLGNFLGENDDASTADVFLQCCLLGGVE